MRKIKNLFATPKKAVISSLCAAAILLTVGTGTVYAAGAIAESSAIGAENAQNFAFADAGVDPTAATIQRTEFDAEMGHFVYEVEFEAAGTQYEYWIKASNGTVLKKEVELVAQSAAPAEAAEGITLEKAKEIALADAGLTADQVTFTEGRLDVDDGNRVYEIGFYAENVEFEYEINAATGDIYSKSKETVIHQPAQDNSDQAAGQISLEDAKNKALSDAGVAAADVTYTKAKLERDDGVMIYDIEFYTATHEYEYEINAATGAVRERSVEAFQIANDKPVADKPVADKPAADNADYIGLSKAKEKALADADVSSSKATFVKAKLEKDDGRMIYDIEFYASSKEYEYELDAITGDILEKNIEAHKTSTSSSSGTNDDYIGVSKAKEKALADAGVSASDVTYTKAKLERDDGVMSYDIEFYTATHEYEYEINATTGAVRERNVEKFKSGNTSDAGSSGTSGNSGTSGDSGSSSNHIGLDKAKSIAVNRAGLSLSQVTFRKAKLEKDDGVMVYDIEFICDGMEYECEINASTGKIREYDCERDD